MKKILKYLFSIVFIFTLTGCRLFSTDTKPNPNYDNTKYFNEGWNVNIPSDSKVEYFCYSTWTSIFSFGGDNYVVYDLSSPMDIKWNDDRSLEFEEYFSSSVDKLIKDYGAEASYGEMLLPDFSNDYIWCHIGENENPQNSSSEFEFKEGNVISCVYFESLDKLFVFSLATHATNVS